MPLFWPFRPDFRAVDHLLVSISLRFLAVGRPRQCGEGQGHATSTVSGVRRAFWLQASDLKGSLSGFYSLFFIMLSSFYNIYHHFIIDFSSFESMFEHLSMNSAVQNPSLPKDQSPRPRGYEGGMKRCLSSNQDMGRKRLALDLEPPEVPLRSSVRLFGAVLGEDRGLRPCRGFTSCLGTGVSFRGRKVRLFPWFSTVFHSFPI